MPNRSKADYERCAHLGLTQAETARRLGVSREAVSQMTKRHGIEFRPDTHNPRPARYLENDQARHHFGCPGDDRDRSNDP